MIADTAPPPSPASSNGNGGGRRAAAAEAVSTMELRERIAAVRTATDPEERLDALAAVSDRIHGALIRQLGPQLANSDVGAPGAA